MAKFEISKGLLEPRHLLAIGPALPLYLVLIADKPYGSPWVAGGRPVPMFRLMASTGEGERSIRRHLRSLETAGYILATYVNKGPRNGSGIKIRILKAKDWRANKLRLHPDPP